MPRFSVTEFNNYIDVTQRVLITDAIVSGMPSASALTAENLRDANITALMIVIDTMLEAFRHLPSVSGATATMFEIGSDPDNWFDITLLEEYDPNDPAGTGGGLVLPGGAPEGSGFQLVPIVTGNGTQVNPQSGAAIPATPFDGVQEISLGSGPTENLFKIDYDGIWDVVASCKPAPGGNQNNREVETDLWVFDGNGDPKTSIGFIASANQGSNGRTFTQSIPRSTLNQAFLGDDEWLGLVVRKFAGEGATTVTLQKAFIQVTLVGLGQ